MSISFYMFASVFIVSALSLIGVVALSLRESFLNRSIFFLVSLAVGALFGDAIIHLIPESFEEIGNPQVAAFFILAGILTFFILEKFLRWHHYHSAEVEHAHGQLAEDKKIKPLGILILVSDGVHNLLDGIIIAASYLVSVEVGIATTAAIILHEIPQEIGDFGVLLHAGFSKAKALFFNFLSALAAVAGVLLVFLFAESIESSIPLIVAFAAGSFLYIAGSDLVPELQKTSGIATSLGQLAAILIGIGLMFSLVFLEEDRAEDAPQVASTQEILFAYSTK